MDTIFVISIFVSLFSLALVIIGIPAQIIKNFKEKRSGQPLLTILIAIGFYISQNSLLYSHSCIFTSYFICNRINNVEHHIYTISSLL